MLLWGECGTGEKDEGKLVLFASLLTDFYNEQSFILLKSQVAVNTSKIWDPQKSVFGCIT